MKRDMDLIREILIKIETDCVNPNAPNLNPLEIPNHDWPSISEHVRLLVEADYLDAIPIDYGLCPTRLTMKGHDFLESIRNDTVWNKVKSEVKSKGGGATLDVVKSLATHFLSQVMGLTAGS